MPYIVTTKTPVQCGEPACRCAGDSPFLSRRAVATLEEARDAVPKFDAALDGKQDRAFYRHQIALLPESGGTVGPLPDGSVIQVQRVEWAGLMSSADIQMGDYDGALARFNARQS